MSKCDDLLAAHDWYFLPEVPVDRMIEFWHERHAQVRSGLALIDRAIVKASREMRRA